MQSSKSPRATSPPSTPAQVTEQAASAPRNETGLPIVGIGASAGGLEALEMFFAHTPPDSGIAFVIVTHMDPHATSFLPELLGRTTSMPVREATEGQRLVPNEVTVMPPGTALVVEGGALHLRDIAIPHGRPLPIDRFFRSLAEEQQEKAIGVILSGTGTDGTVGARAIKSMAGMVMVQEAQSAKFAGMPQSAIDAGLPDYVLPPEQMPAALRSYVQSPYHARSAAAPSTLDIAPEVLQDVMSLVHSHTGHSFTPYKISSIRRRVERRLILHQIAQPEQYPRYLREHPDELDRLFHELLIGVTAFFRDPEAFAALATIVPALLRTKRNGEPVRVWVPGCSTGEEAYSLAMLLRECLELAHKPCPVQIFATDLDDRAIETARLGRYPEGIAADVTPERLQRFFTHEDAAYQITKEIRETVIFAPHNLLVDPPFTHLDLLSCRNLLIYIDANTQHQLLDMFHYALHPGGVLFLGTSETIGHSDDLFSTQDRQWKIFTRNDVVPPAYPLPEHTAPSFYPAITRAPQSSHDVQGFSTPGSQAEAYLAQRYAPPSVLITTRGDIVHFHGRTAPYLEPPRGQPSLNIFRMAREGLDQVLAPTIRAALAQDAPVVRPGITVTANGTTVTTDVIVERVHDSASLQGLLLVTFRPPATDPAPTANAVASPTPRRRRLVDVERELKETRESLQYTIEALEATNEELTSANEELQSTNEEMQSANEELKTSREEMQSLNEELQTVNAELHSKVDELSHANDDMTNLLNSTDIATIFLDDVLQIKRFTTQATRVMALILSDVGRPISDLTSHLDYATLVEDAHEVLRTLVPQEKEVRTNDGMWYLVRIMPYRTSENVIDGLVITFVDIDHVKRAESARQRASEQLEAEVAERRRIEERLQHLSKVFMEATVPIILEDVDGSITDLNAEAEQTYGWRREELIGQPITTLVPAEFQAQINDLLARCRRGENLRNVETVRQTKAGEDLRVLLTVSPLTDRNGEVAGMVTIAKHPDARPRNVNAP